MLLLTSPLLVALGVRSLRRPYFVGAFLCAVALVGCRSLEYTLLLRHGVTPVAVVKFRLVGLHFMHLCTAPALLRGLFEGYVVVVESTLVSLLLFVS